MDENLEKDFQESESEWAEIEKKTAIRIQKDKRIISRYCAANKEADIFHTLQLLEKYKGMADHDEKIVNEFKNNYPKNLTVQMIHNFEDVKEIYREYLEYGEEKQ